MILISWNVRGLGCPIKQRSVKDLFHPYKGEIVCVQEPKLSTPFPVTLRSISTSRIRDWIFLDSHGASSKQLVGWNPHLFDCIHSLKGTFSLPVKFKCIASNSLISISSVYGSTDQRQRQALWAELCSLEQWASEIWTIDGDFNVTHYASERSGGQGRRIDRENFNSFISDLSLIDMPTSGRTFTWSNSRAAAKLDRFLTSSHWEDQYPLSTITVLPNTCYDHSPLLLDTFDRPQHLSIFRFERFSLEHPELPSFVAASWLST